MIMCNRPAGSACRAVHEAFEHKLRTAKNGGLRVSIDWLREQSQAHQQEFDMLMQRFHCKFAYLTADRYLAFDLGDLCSDAHAHAPQLHGNDGEGGGNGGGTGGVGSGAGGVTQPMDIPAHASTGGNAASPSTPLLGSSPGEQFMLSSTSSRQFGGAAARDVSVQECYGEGCNERKVVRSTASEESNQNLRDAFWPQLPNEDEDHRIDSTSHDRLSAFAKNTLVFKHNSFNHVLGCHVETEVQVACVVCLHGGHQDRLCIKLEQLKGHVHCTSDRHGGLRLRKIALQMLALDDGAKEMASWAVVEPALKMQETVMLDADTYRVIMSGGLNAGIAQGQASFQNNPQNRTECNTTVCALQPFPSFMKCLPKPDTMSLALWRTQLACEHRDLGADLSDQGDSLARTFEYQSRNHASSAFWQVTEAATEATLERRRPQSVLVAVKVHTICLGSIGDVWQESSEEVVTMWDWLSLAELEPATTGSNTQ